MKSSWLFWMSCCIVVIGNVTKLGSASNTKTWISGVTKACTDELGFSRASWKQLLHYRFHPRTEKKLRVNFHYRLFSTIVRNFICNCPKSTSDCLTECQVSQVPPLQWVARFSCEKDGDQDLFLLSIKIGLTAGVTVDSLACGFQSSIKTGPHSCLKKYDDTVTAWHSIPEKNA